MSPSLKWKCLATLLTRVGLLAEFLGRQVVVQKRRAVAHGVGRGQHAAAATSYSTSIRPSGFLGDVRAGGGDGGDGVALVEHLAAGQDIAANDSSAASRLRPARRC